MNVLVTGGAGFIGSHIAESLVNSGNEVSILDNLHTGNLFNLNSFRDSINFINARSGEISKFGKKFDVIIHQGIYSSSPMYRENPQLLPMVLDDWILLLEYARRNDTKIVFASTSSLYNGAPTPFNEDSAFLATDYYTEARYAIERLATLYSNLYSMNIVGLRYFSVYGPRERFKGKFANLVSQFVWEIKNGSQPLIFGDGKQSRDFIYVSDVVDANLLAIDYKKSDFFNVGTGKCHNLNQVVELINTKLKKNIQPIYQVNLIKNYVQNTLADTSKAENLLGFRSKISLERGIELLLNYS